MCSQVINNTLTKTKDFAKQKITQNQQLTDQNRELAAANLAHQLAHQVFVQRTQQEINELQQQYNELVDKYNKLKVAARREATLKRKYMDIIMRKGWQHLTYEQLTEFHEQYTYEELLEFIRRAEQAEAENKRLNEQLIKANTAARGNISSRLHKQ